MKQFKALFALVKQVLQDPRVIITLVGFLIVLMIAGFIANYTKKARKPKKKKNVVVVQQPQPQSEESENTESEAAEEE